MSAQEILAKILLAPFAWLFSVVLGVRNVMYSSGLLKATMFNLPVINVGNLTLGGAGKTPHVEFLVQKFRPYLNLGILSRGYKRETKGFRYVEGRNSVRSVGDEPLQFKRKFSDVVVAVSESRALGIPQIIQNFPSTQLILLDDAYQHRSIKPGLNILLTEYDNLYVHDFLLPMGRLREGRHAAQRANIIVVSKCPLKEEDVQREDVMDVLKLESRQKVFFSFYSYREPYYIFNPAYRLNSIEGYDLILLCAIANTQYLQEYLEDSAHKIYPIFYEDHHYYNGEDLDRLNLMFQNLDASRKAIITTEKDAMRLIEHQKFILTNELPIYVLPIEVNFHFDEGPVFVQQIKEFLLNFKV